MNERPLIEELGDEKETPYQRYCRMFVGAASLRALVRYELMTGLLGPMPGALGYVLRAKCYRRLLHELGRGSILGRGVVLRCPGRISLGVGVMIDDDVVLDAKGATSSIELGEQILVGRSSILSCNEGSIRIGNFVSIGPFCVFASKSHIHVGSNVAIGCGTRLLAGAHARDAPDTPIIRQRRLSKGIVVEDGVWIGTEASILDGVTIGHDSIVGAGSVVSKDVPPWSVVLGNPARVVQKRNQDAEA